jgi:hypothetical protein
LFVSPIVFASLMLSTASLNPKPSAIFNSAPIMSLNRADSRIFSAFSTDITFPAIWSFVEQRIEGAATNDRKVKVMSDLWFTTDDRVEIAILYYDNLGRKIENGAIVKVRIMRRNARNF